MSRLPVSGSDRGVWGKILNDFLNASLNSDGTLKSIGTGGLQDGAVTNAKLGVTLDQVSAPTADVSAGSQRFTDVTDPTSDQDGATKAYADTKVSRSGDTMTGKLTEAEVVLDDGATITIDASLGNIFKVTIADNRTMAAPTNPTSGQKISLRIKQDINGGHTITWNAAFRFSTDIPQPTLTTNPNSFDYLKFVYNAADSKWDCTAVVKAVPNPSTASAGTMTLVTTHPNSPSIPSSFKGIHVLFPFNSKLYAGYGDYGVNSGPIHIQAWTGAVWTDEYTAQTETIDEYFVINGTLMVPYIDARPNGSSYDFAALESGTWTPYRTGPDAHEATTHNFAMTYFESKIWTAGSSYGTPTDSTLYSASTAAGPWTEYRYTDDGRIMYVWQMGGVLYSVNSARYVRQWNGSTWVLNGWQLPFASHRMREFNGKTMYTPSRYGAPTNAGLRSISSAGVHQLYGEVGACYDLWIEGSYIYVLCDGNSSTMVVMRSTNLTGWEYVAIAPSTGESLAVMGSTLYVGTTVGTLYSIAIP